MYIKVLCSLLCNAGANTSIKHFVVKPLCRNVTVLHMLNKTIVLVDSSVELQEKFHMLSN